MNISYQWLCDYLPQSISPQELSILLTRIGLEVEEVSDFSTIQGNLEGLVVGRIKKIESVPNADKIRLTKVQIRPDSEETLDIVCGAPNVEENRLVVVALPDVTIYPIGGDPLTIRKAKIRGVESHGMLCSKKEIGLSQEHSGILLLDDNARVGMAVKELFPVYNDTIFSVNLTANRNDAMSHYGVARDICAYWSYQQNKVIQPLPPKTKPLHIVTSVPYLSVDIQSPKCERYSTLCASNISIAPAPLWIQHRLLAIGQATINNIVDATNYVLHDIGQPLHAFDQAKIKGNKIIVRQGLHSEFVTLDHQKRTLHEADLMICNQDEPMCIAGVFGGLESGISASTQAVVFESAYFDSQTIRATSLRYGLRTEAAVHFEKKIDKTKVAFALQRLAFLLEDMGVSFASEILDVLPQPIEQRYIDFSLTYLDELAGKHYDPQQVKTLLESLGYGIQSKSQDAWTVEIPNYKSSITCAAELAEEAVRIDGLEAIPMHNEISFPFQSTSKFERHIVNKEIATYLSGMGFSEVMHNSIVDSSQYKNEDQTAFVFLQNSLSVKHDLMRPRMMETGLQSVAFNLNRKYNDLKMFEFGKTYQSKGKKQFEESHKLGIWISGQWLLPDWKTSTATPSTFQHIVSVVEVLAKQFAIVISDRKAIHTENFETSTAFFSQQQQWALAGKASPDILKQMGIKQDVWYAELSMDFLLAHLRQHKTLYREGSRFHDIYRDIAFFVEGSVVYQEVKMAIEQLHLPNVVGIDLFDRYQNPTNQKCSLGVRLQFRSYDKTLTEEECSVQVQKAMQMLERTFSAEIRKV